MSELSELFAKPRAIHGLNLLPVRFADLEEFIALTASVRLFIQTDSDVVSTVLWDDIKKFIVIGSRENISNLSKLKPEQIIECLQEVIDINQDVLKKKNNKNTNQERLVWFSVFQQLVSCGFSTQEVSDMTMKQVMNFSEVSQTSKLNDLQTQLIIMRAAQADKDGYKKVFDALSVNRQDKYRKNPDFKTSL